VQKDEIGRLGIYLPGMRQLFEEVIFPQDEFPGFSLNNVELSNEDWRRVVFVTLSTVNGPPTGGLAGREARVIRLRYDLQQEKQELEERYGVVRKNKNLSFRLIGEIISDEVNYEAGLSSSRIHQIHESAVKKLRHSSRRDDLKIVLQMTKKLPLAELIEIYGEFCGAFSSSSSDSIERILSKPLCDYSVSARTANALEHLGIDTVGDLASKKASDFLSLKNCGRKSLLELRAILGIYDLDFRPENSGNNYMDPFMELMDKEFGTICGVDSSEHDKEELRDLALMR
tara:strand:+ start:3342 stop:4199 length:858 start_codon:yes stop_codon:yes gene_type:complete